jgi:hypothetical protein
MAVAVAVLETMAVLTNQVKMVGLAVAQVTVQQPLIRVVLQHQGKVIAAAQMAVELALLRMVLAVAAALVQVLLAEMALLAFLEMVEMDRILAFLEVQ